MGTRINKVVGYGVTDFKAPEQWRSLLRKARQTTLYDFMDYCLSRDKDIQKLYIQLGYSGQARSLRSDITFARQMLRLGKPSVGSGERRVSHLLGYESEEGLGLPNVLVLVPVSEAYEWYRYDDPVDYFEETRRADGMEPRVMELNMGLFPYVQGRPPPTVLGLLLWLGMTHLAPQLKELLYVYWS